MAIPTITIEDHDREKPKVVATDAPEPSVAEADDRQGDVNEMPGSMPASPAPTIPSWYRVGWRQNSGISNIVEGEEKDQTIIASFLDEQLYGDWYHNAAVIVFVRFYPLITPKCASQFLTRLSFCRLSSPPIS